MIKYNCFIKLALISEVIKLDNAEETKEIAEVNPNFKMLEVKNVTKIYKTKGGTETRALDDVSISFGQTGLVFLLGKSGSGKSTLLNVSGGLDEPTSGEIIVKGKSSKDFTGADFDSYRNTFVGFIFQEYNILDEFNVEDNIALALELQGKPKDREKINSLLRDVELEAFAKRKPNTLSGGQKQRIAIARALVKEPQIIMADEPTGALDSATGKQVFDTLKKLSQTRLVIVVSHDREFAEIYGDRIVELQDGKIISDVTKEHVPPERLDENVSVIGGNTLSIKSGSELTAANMKTIQDFIKNTAGDVIITNGTGEIANFKKSNRMSDSGSTETFGETKADALTDKHYSVEESKFIRSRLPAAKAIRIGASGLKLKPIRLIFTIFLSCIAFTMFGLFSTLMTYDGKEVAAKSFADSGYEYLNVTKKYKAKITSNYSYGESYSYTDEYSAGFSEEEVKKLTSEYGSASYGYFSPEGGDSVASIKNVEINESGSMQIPYYQASLNKFAYVPEGHRLRTERFIGTYPANKGEICISSYIIDVFKSSGTVFANVTFDEDGEVKSYSNKDKITVNSAQDVIGKYIVLNNVSQQEKAFKITGVFDSGTVDSKFDKIKDKEDADFILMASFTAYMNGESLHQLALVSEDFYDEYADAFEARPRYVEHFKDSLEKFSYYEHAYDFNDETGEYEIRPDYEREIYLANEVAAYGGDKQLEIYMFDRNKTTLEDDEMVIDIDDLCRMNMLYAIVMNDIMARVKSGEIEGFEFSDETDPSYYNYMVYRFAYDYYYYKNENPYDIWCMYSNGYYYKWDDDGNTQKQVFLNRRERLQALEKLLGLLKKLLTTFELKICIGDNDSSGSMSEPLELNMKVVGFYLGDYYNQSGIYLTQSFIDANVHLQNSNYSYTSSTNYVKSENEKYAGIMLDYDGRADTYKKLVKSVGMNNADEHDVYLNIENSLYEMVELANTVAETLSAVFLGAGISFAVFASLLLFNFVSMSISNKRKEIGILRAVGARGIDVFKIFFAESGIIVGICTLLSLVGTVAVCAILNTVLRTQLGLSIALFVFGIVSVAMMIAIALVVAFVSTFLPVFFAARKKPVDSIRAL